MPVEHIPPAIGELSAPMLDERHLLQLFQHTQAELSETREKLAELEGQLSILEKLKLRIAQLEGLERQLEYMVQGKAPPESNFAQTLQGTHQRRRRKAYSHTNTVLPQGSSGAFFPEKAYEGADEILQYRHSVNYEIFRAVVLNGGQASTRDIRDYLIEHNIKTPAGKTFEDARLSEVSARTAYLVKKGVIQAIAPGRFQSCFGWA
jgi:hypothetical protein